MDLPIFDYTMCKFITDFFFTDVGLVLTVRLRAKEMIHFRNDTEKKMFELCSFYALCLLHLSTCLTGWVYDHELGLYWLTRVEAPVLNPILCGVHSFSRLHLLELCL